jgi:uroporphyrinogen-III synthase
MIYLLSPKITQDIRNFIQNYQNITLFPTTKIEFLSQKIDISKYDLFIFTSKNGVQAFDKNLKNSSDWKKVNTLAVGKKTAESILNFGGKIAEEPNSQAYGENLLFSLKKISEKYKNKKLKIAWIRPEKVVTDLELLAQKNNLLNIKIEKFILYKSSCKTQNTNQKFNPNDIFIITAPSTYSCLINAKIELYESNKFVAIGKKSYDAIDQKFDRYISKAQTLESVIIKALEI